MVRKISPKVQRVLRLQYYDKENSNYYADVDKFHTSLKEQGIKISMEQLKIWLSKQRDKIDKYLHDTYYDIGKAGSYGTPLQLYRRIHKDGKYKISYKELINWMSSQRAYLLHKLVKRQFRTSRVIYPPVILHMLDIDTMVLTKYSKDNEGVKYVLVACDPCTLMIYGQPMMEQSGDSILKAFKEILKSLTKKPKIIRSDKHASFKSKIFVDFLKEQEIYIQYTYNIQKALGPLAAAFGHRAQGNYKVTSGT